MLQSMTRWKVASQDTEEAKQLAAEAGTSTLVAQLLLNRNIRTPEAAKRFLNIEDQPFYDPSLLLGMKETVERIRIAVRNGERILIFGDYDADGVTSTAMMMKVLREIGAEANYYIPNRFTEGYGPNKRAFQRAKEEGYRLIVTVDTGISAVDEAKFAKELNLDLIITDHHQPPPMLPDAFSIVNPHQKDCLYPFKELSGAGVAFKVAHALLGYVPEHLLDLAALGTIADLVPLVEENRLIARRGLDALKMPKEPGVSALLQTARVQPGTICEQDIAFALGPRLNAVGRLDTANPAVDLLLAEDREKAVSLAKTVERANNERKELVKQMTIEAVEEIEARFPPEDHRVLVVAKEGWHPGVTGIVASRLVERYGCPAVVMGIEEDTERAKGSARSIDGFDMFAHLSLCRDLLIHFGGHPMAAGLTTDISSIDALRTTLNEQADQTLTPEDFIPLREIDLRCKVSDISIELIEEFGKLAPFGVGNPTPKVLVEKAPLVQLKRVGNENNHLKAVFSEDGIHLEGIGFRLGHLYHEIAPSAIASVTGELQINEWNGYRKPQLLVEDVAVRHWQLFDWRAGRGLSEKFKSLPEDKTIFISFHPETAKHFAIERSVNITETTGEIPDFSGRYVVLLDLPEEKEALERLFTQRSAPERIYAVFAHENKHFFSTIPTREHFKWFYALLLKRKSLDLEQYGAQLSKMKGWSGETVTFMAKVFAELDFVTIDESVVSLRGQPAKRDLSESPAYRKKLQQAMLENDLCYSSYSSLREWFAGILGEPQKLEEAMK